jgi:hypothetical protein
MFDFIKENLINFNYPNYSRELNNKVDESELTDEWRRILDKVFSVICYYIQYNYSLAYILYLVICL